MIYKLQIISIAKDHQNNKLDVARGIIKKYYQVLRNMSLFGMLCRL